MKKFLLTIITFFILVGCRSNQNKEVDTKHIFYLHGRIIEIQGKNAVSERFGVYEFDKIVSAIQEIPNSKVYAELRTENVDTREYAMKLSAKIDSLLKTGANPKNITVIGASKGAIIASHLSDLNLNPINYILLAGNNSSIEQENNWHFHGQVLAIYDQSDEIAGKDYSYWMNQENSTTKFEQVEINTKLGHGFLYKPLNDWMIPTKKWILEHSN